MKEYVGLLEAEDTPAGVKYWIYVGDYTKKEWSREFLIPIEPGDELKILNYTRKILWTGVVKPVGQDSTVSPERWNKFFYQQFNAILIKNE